MDKIRIAITGANGRMGKALAAAIGATGDMTLAGALKRGDDPAVVLKHADALIDFTAPESSLRFVQQAASANVPLVLGTTGLSGSDEAKIRDAAKHIAIVKSGNMSVGVTLLAALARHAAKALPDFDIEIVEMHHRQKADAPSGTALLLGEAAAQARNIPLKGNEQRGRDGQTGPRKSGIIGFASLRGGTVVGEHDVILAGPHERVVLRHIAEDRAIFANGALAAARWIKGKKPGLYSMSDVLGL